MTGSSSSVSSAQYTPTAHPGRCLSRLRMPSRREAIAPTVDWILEVAKPAGLDDDQRQNLAVATSEALSNAVIHGNSSQPGRPVLVLACVDADQGLIVDVRDFGRGFDTARLLDCRDEERVLAPRGRGIFLMRHLSDDVEYNRRGNRVRLSFRRRAEAEACSRSGS
jgi:serine/threonine-protein kinase RsbW